MRAEVVDRDEKKGADDWTLVVNADGQCQGLKTMHLEEMGRGVALLRAVVRALRGELALPYLPDAAKALLELLDFQLDEEIRGDAAMGLSEVLVCALKGLLTAFLDKALLLIQAEEKPAKKARPLVVGL